LIPFDSSITSVSLPNLKIIGFLNLSGPQINTINFSSLANIEGPLGIYSIATNTAISFPALQNIGSTLNVDSFQTDSISFPNLLYIGGAISLSPSAGINPQTLNLNSLQTIFGSGVTIQMSNLASFTLPSLKYVANGCNIYLYTTLNEASVDSLLVSLAALDGTNGTTLWNNGGIGIAGANAAPSATGIAARDILTARGIGVSTN
jgi:hypothetical protein